MAKAKKTKKVKADKDELKKKKRGRPKKSEAEKSSKKKKTKKAEKTTKASKKTKTGKKSSKKTAPKKKAARKKADARKITPITEKFTKNQLFEYLETVTDVPKKDVKKVMLALEEVFLGSVVKRSRGEFMMPGLFKIVRKDVPAKPKRKVRNPATGEMVWSGPKPASKKVVIRPMIKLKKAAKGEL